MPSPDLGFAALSGVASGSFFLPAVRTELRR